MFANQGSTTVSFLPNVNHVQGAIISLMRGKVTVSNVRLVQRQIMLEQLIKSSANVINFLWQLIFEWKIIIEKLVSGTNCEGDVRGPMGYFQSPNFPSDYPTNSACKWEIGPFKRRRILLVIPDIQLADQNCEDYLVIRKNCVFTIYY